MSVVIGSNIDADGKLTLQSLPIIEMNSDFPELDPGVDYSLAPNRTSLSLGPLVLPMNVTIEIPVGASWVIL